MSKLTSLTLLTVLVGVLVALKLPPRVNLPQHLLGHPAMFVKDFLAPDIAKELMRVAKEEMVEFPTNVADTKFYDPFREHIGEAVPLVNGSCEHPFMTPNKARTACVLAGRIDIGRHFILHGGFGGVKETYERAVSRLQSFGQFIFDADRYPVVSQLFASDKFQSAAKSTCPEERQFLDPFQFNFIVQVPGQTVTIHVDGVYFDHADRFTFPQWFLAAMKMSGLWEDEFVPQIQVVGYFHEWDWSPARSGEFVYWDENGPAKRLPPLPRAASVVDGSKVVHSATIYRPDDMPPILDKSKSHTLKYVGDERWELRTEGETRRNYTTDDLRWTIVYRAKCFKDEAARDAFNAMKVEEKHSLESILAKFIKDLVKRGKLSNEQQGWDMDRLQLGVLIMDTYIHYPLPETAWIPYNYCALSRLFSWTAPLLRPFCE